jgi:hypothetical protein
MIVTGKTEILGEESASVPLSHIWTGLASKPGLRDDRPTTDGLTAMCVRVCFSARVFIRRQCVWILALGTVSYS